MKKRPTFEPYDEKYDLNRPDVDRLRKLLGEPPKPSPKDDEQKQPQQETNMTIPSKKRADIMPVPPSADLQKLRERAKKAKGAAKTDA